MYRRTLLAALVATAFPAVGQVRRNFPANALRGVIEFGLPPVVEVNGNAARLSPGSRIFGTDNMVVMSGAVAGGKFVVNYTVDEGHNLVNDVWLLRPDEIANRPWPVNYKEASTWLFDPVGQRWIKR